MPYKDPDKRREMGRAYSKTWRNKTPENLAIARAWGAKSSIKWRKEHPEENKRRVAEYTSSHSEEAKKRAKEWRELHPNAQREWVAQHPGWIREYRAKNPEQFRAYSRNRNALRRAAIGTHTATDIVMIRISQVNRCYYCDKPLGRSYHVDHKQPLSRGGSNNPSNLCCACPTCNLRKHDATEAEFVLRQFAGSGCST
jgi:5-methylcytosine-specific restriction endonuclease McrA